MNERITQLRVSTLHIPWSEAKNGSSMPLFVLYILRKYGVGAGLGRAWQSARRGHQTVPPVPANTIYQVQVGTTSPSLHEEFPFK